MACLLSRSAENKNATENAISSLGKVLQFQPASLDGEQYGSLWVNSLPLTADKAEAKAVHAQLVHFLEQSDPRYPTQSSYHGQWREIGPQNRHGCEVHVLRACAHYRQFNQSFVTW